MRKKIFDVLFPLFIGFVAGWIFLQVLIFGLEKHEVFMSYFQRDTKQSSMTLKERLFLTHCERVKRLSQGQCDHVSCNEVMDTIKTDPDRDLMDFLKVYDNRRI